MEGIAGALEDEPCIMGCTMASVEPPRSVVTGNSSNPGDSSPGEVRWRKAAV